MPFQRDDAIHVAVGSVLFTVALGVITAAVISVGMDSDPNWCATWFWVLVGPSAGVAVIGAYMLLAPYTGLRLPSTYRERSTRPSLRIVAIDTVKVLSNRVVIRLGLMNDGPVDLIVTANVLVPDFVDYISMCHPDGTDAWAQGPKLPTAERLEGAESYESIYWQTGPDGIRAPARTAVPIYLCVGLNPVRPFPVKAKAWSSDLPGAIVSTAFAGPDAPPPRILAPPAPPPISD